MSDSDSYGTPAWVWQPWHKLFNFVLDAAASDANRLPCVTTWYTKEKSAFDQDWVKDSEGGTVWCNPPYGKKDGPIDSWIQKARAEARRGATIVMLLPSDTSTRWFHGLWDDHLARESGTTTIKVSVRFVQGRIRFVGAKDPAKFGSIIVVLEPHVHQ
jgi:phage N-6-adenine-methyltransferase